jgi:hypothetical protein
VANKTWQETQCPAGTATPVKDQILTVIPVPVMKKMTTKMIMIWKTVLIRKMITMKAVME